MPSLNRYPWIAIGLVTAIALASYFNTFSSPFIFDDTLAVTYNSSIRSLWPPGSLLAPPSESTAAGRPLVNVSYGINYALGGMSVWGYHAVNLGFHLGAALLLFGVVRRTLEYGRSGESVALALAVSALWAAHPLLTGAVSYISQRAEVIMAFFYLGTLYAFIRAVNGGSRYWLGASVLACFMGIASKEVTATAPLLILLYDRGFVAGSARAAFRQRPLYYISLAASWLLLALLLAGLKDRAVGYGLGVSWWTYALTECRAVWGYLRLTLWPFPLVFDYGPLFVDRVGEVWREALGLSVALAGTGFALLRWPRVGFVLAACFLILAPTSSVIPIATQPMAENRMYLPSAAIICLMVLGVRGAVGSLPWFVLGAVTLPLVSLSLQRNKVYRSPLALWTDTVLKRPANPRAYEGLGEALHALNRFEEAKQQIQGALRIKADYPEAHNNLGTTLTALGDAAGAQHEFEEAVRLKPDYAIAHNNLGNLFFRLGRLDQARFHGEEALRIYADPRRLKPELPQALNNLGNVLLYQGDLKGALARYGEAVRLEPEFIEARMNLGVALRLVGETGEAKSQLERVLVMKPDSPDAHFNLGVVFQQVGQLDDAVAQFEAALRLKPDFAEAHSNLGYVLRHKGDLNGAKTHFEAVLRVRPNDAAIRAALAEVMAALGANRPVGRPPL